MTATHTPIDLSQATVRDAMHRGVITTAPDTRLTTVAATMAAYAVHAVVLLGPRRDGGLVISDLDVVSAALDGRFESPAVDVAREPLLTVTASDPLEHAIALMATRDESHLLVCDPQEEWPSGVLSSLDVMAMLAGRDPALTRVVRPAPARPLVSARDLAATTVAAVMHPGVVTCLPDEELEQVARTMADLHIHCVAVVGVDGGSLVWGLVTDMDVLHAAYRDGAAKAGALASASPVAVPASASLDAAAALMADRGATHVIAVDRSGAPTGVVSSLDVLRIVAAC
jgi:CBS domain-containing protein